MRPMILLTPRKEHDQYGHDILYNNEDYLELIKKAGGTPVQAGWMDEAEAAHAADLFDGLLITGGSDVNPALYGEPSAKPVSLTDVNDFQLYHAFRRAGKPILGICRGIQVIGAAEGVKLIADIPSLTHTEHNQKNLVPPKAYNDFAHSVTFAKGTRFHEIFGDRHPVNSYHHQALQSVPEGFLCAGISTEDSIIEAIEKENVLAVQWHPERLTDDSLHLKIAETFIQNCLLGKSE